MIELLKKNKGVALVELIIYLGLVVALLSVITTSVMTSLRFYQRTQSLSAIESSGLASLERLGREVRAALSIDALSVLDVSPGHLVLATTADDGSPTTAEFYLSGQTLMVKKGGVEIGPLTRQSARVTNLIFSRLLGGESQAVKIDLTLESVFGPNYQERRWSDTIVLRGAGDD